MVCHTGLFSQPAADHCLKNIGRVWWYPSGRFAKKFNSWDRSVRESQDYFFKKNVKCPIQKPFGVTLSEILDGVDITVKMRDQSDLTSF